MPGIASTDVASRRKMDRPFRANAIRAILDIFAPTVSFLPNLTRQSRRLVNWPTNHLYRFAADVNDCADSPCRNGGTCIDGIDSFHCVCPKGYEGLTCDHSKLFLFFKKYQFVLELDCQIVCVDVDDCAGNPCRNNGTCVDMVSDFVCRCVDGWKGRTCSNRNQHCQNGENPCLNGATCVDDSDPEAGFTCRCTSGWRGSICHLGK